jgi:hypothetical protein
LKRVEKIFIAARSGTISQHPSQFTIHNNQLNIRYVTCAFDKTLVNEDKGFSGYKPYERGITLSNISEAVCSSIIRD